MGRSGRPPKAGVEEKSSRVGISEEPGGNEKGMSVVSEGEEIDRELRLDVSDGLGFVTEGDKMIRVRAFLGLGDLKTPLPKLNEKPYLEAVQFGTEEGEPKRIEGDAKKEMTRMDFCSSSRFDALKGVAAADNGFLGEVDSGKS
ncbi:hypothetical protein Dimus_013874, partial [Dionaea muscipula]